MLATDLGRAALLATIPFAYAFHVLTFAQLYVVGFLVGTLSVVFFVSYNTLFVELVPRDRYLDANSLVHGSRAISYVRGPSVGGLLGSIVTVRISRRLGVGPAFILGCVLFPAPLVLVPLAGGGHWRILAFLFAAESLSVFGVMILDITSGSIKAALVPDRLRAR